MRLFFKLTIFVFLFFTMCAATENYGGIGIAVYKSNRGVSIVRIAKNSPADVAGLNIGDCIIEVDGVALRDKSVVDAKNMIRGALGRPVSLKLARGNEILMFDIARVDLSVVTVKDEKEANIMKCSNCKLLDVVSTRKNKAGFYVKDEKGPIFSEIKTVDILKSLKLLSFSRRKITIDVKKDSPFNVTLYTMDGTFVRRLAVSNAKMGQMDVRWDNSVLPVGQYTIELEQENKKNRSVKRLR